MNDDRSIDGLLRGIKSVHKQLDEEIWSKVKECGSILADIDPQYRKPLMRHIRLEILMEQGRRCAVPECRAILSETSIEEDHLVPISYGGGNERRNIRLLCRRCNRERGNDLEGHVDQVHMIQYIEDRLRNLPSLSYMLTVRHATYLNVVNDHDDDDVLAAGSASLLARADKVIE
jgi:5-methylcytosine-specific restriction endonuclease McrA